MVVLINGVDHDARDVICICYALFGPPHAPFYLPSLLFCFALLEWDAKSSQAHMKKTLHLFFYSMAKARKEDPVKYINYESMRQV